MTEQEWASFCKMLLSKTGKNGARPLNKEEWKEYRKWLLKVKIVFIVATTLLILCSIGIPLLIFGIPLE